MSAFFLLFLHTTKSGAKGGKKRRLRQRDVGSRSTRHALSAHKALLVWQQSTPRLAKVKARKCAKTSKNAGFCHAELPIPSTFAISCLRNFLPFNVLSIWAHLAGKTSQTLPGTLFAEIWRPPQNWNVSKNVFSLSFCQIRNLSDIPKMSCHCLRNVARNWQKDRLQTNWTKQKGKLDWIERPVCRNRCIFALGFKHCY